MSEIEILFLKSIFQTEHLRSLQFRFNIKMTDQKYRPDAQNFTHSVTIYFLYSCFSTKYAVQKKLKF
jgi:hypothetical protein